MKKSYQENKIIYLIDNLCIGGAQIHLLCLAESLNDKGCPAEIVCLGAAESSLGQISSNMLIHHLKMDCVWKPVFWINFFKLVLLLRKIQPAIVHTYLNTSNVFGVFAARLAKVPIVISSRRDLGHFRSGLIGKLETMTARLSNKVVCVSEAVCKAVIEKEGLNSDKTTVIYNGTNAEIFSAKKAIKNDGYFNISMVATMNREKKGHIYFLQAAEIIIRERKDVRFNLIGDGNLRPALESYVKLRGLGDYFNFRGQCYDLQKELNNTDILVVPSESEGCSNALLEAMAMGISPVATAVEGNLEIIEDGISGVLVKPRDTSAIAQKILELLDSPLQMKKIGLAARQRILDKFSLEKMVDAYQEIYTGLYKAKKVFKLKVGYIVSLFPCWSETFILNELIELKKRGIAATIFSLRRDLEKFTQEKAKPFVPFTKYPSIPNVLFSMLFWGIRKPFPLLSLFFMVLNQEYQSYKIFWKNLWSVLAGCYFARIAKKERLDHLHAHFASYPALTAMAISKLSGIPFSFTCHAHDIFLDKTLLKEKARAAKNIIAISHYNKQYLESYCQNGIAEKTKVVHCGISLEEFKFLQQKNGAEKKLIVAIGRLSEMKGFENLIKACARIQWRVPFTCKIVGEGEQHKALQKLITDLKLNDRVFLSGYLDNYQTKELLNQADLFVLPSIWSNRDGQDGIPLVLMEAMAIGVPVISTKISGIPELIEDGKSGLLVEPANVDALAEKMIALLENRELATQLALKGREKVEREFDVVKSVEVLSGIFGALQMLDTGC